MKRANLKQSLGHAGRQHNYPTISKSLAEDSEIDKYSFYSNIIDTKLGNYLRNIKMSIETINDTRKRPEDNSSNEIDRRKLLAGGVAGAAALFLAGCENPIKAKPVEARRGDDQGSEAPVDTPKKADPERNSLSEFEQKKQEFQNIGGSFGDKVIDDINEQLGYDKNYADNAPEGAVPDFYYRYYPGDRGQMTVVSPTLHTEGGGAYRVEIVYDELDPSIYGESDDALLTNDLSGLKGADIKEVRIVKYPDITSDGEYTDYGDESSYEVTTEIDVDESVEEIRIIDNAPYLPEYVPEVMSYDEAMSLIKELEESLGYVEN